jgi:hypothetical protein
VAAAETNEAPASAAPAAISADDTLKHLEVTGLRISEVNRKPHISMVVVNHASAELTDINANVLVRTTKDRAGAPALAKLQLKLSSIGANDVKEVSMPFPTTLRAYELPDWQFLRAEVSH